MIKDYQKTAIMAGDKEVSYSEMLFRIGHFCNLMAAKEGEKTLIISENSEGYIYAFFAVWKAKGIAVPVDASSTVSDVAYILNDCRPEHVWVSAQTEATTMEAIRQVGLETSVLRIDDHVAEPYGTDVDKSLSLPTDMQQTALIIYTSGTTGSPKGVMLSYANLWANMNSVSVDVPILTSERRVLMLLPIHHILPLMGTMIIPIVQGGGVIICPSLTGPDIMDCLQRGRVGAMVGVPRLWQMLYSGIKKKIDASALTRGLFNLCAKVQSKRLSRLIFSSVHKKMGGHLDYCVSGGASLDKDIAEGLATLGLDVLEGYGMTETAPIISFTRPGDIIPGCTGLPLPGVETKLVNGELCAKGPNVMQGYYNRPEETAAVIDKDGFVHTGDLATIDEKGRIYITGRTKEIIVLSNGKNVQPNEIEYKLEQYDHYVKEAAVMQDGDMLRALIVPQDAWAQGKVDEEMEAELKTEVIQPYNQTVTNYKKVMQLTILHEPLPRTRLEKLQRYKFRELLDKAQQGGAVATSHEETVATSVPAESEVMRVLRTYIEGEKKIGVKATDHIETDLGFDSLDRVGLQGFIEATFGIELKADRLTAFPNLGAMAQHIEQVKTRIEVEDIDWHTMLTQAKGNLTLPKCSLLLPLGSRAFKVFYKLYNRLSIRGTEHIPNGPCIIAPNHQSFLDSPVAMSGMTWNQLCDCYFYTAEKHVQSPLRRYLARHNNIIIMEQADLKNSILRLAEVLKQDKKVMIFPEGTRSRDGELLPFKKMFAILSKELNIPIIPVRITGAVNALPRGAAFIRPSKITVEYFPAVLPQEGETYDALSDRVRKVLTKV